MKVAYVLPSLQEPSGWRSHSIAFIQAISAHVEPVLFVSTQDQHIARTLFPEHVIFVLPTTQTASFQSLRGINKLFACYMTVASQNFPSVDLVHSLEAYPTGLVGNWLAAKIKSLHIMTVHGTYGVIWHEHTINRAIYKHVLSKTALVCPVSNRTAQIMYQYFGKALARSTVQPILNGNQYWSSVPRDSAFNRQFPEKPVYLTVGDIKPRKGQHISLAAFSMIKQQHPNASYMLVGRISNLAYYEQLKDFIRKHTLSDVHFLGAISNEELKQCYQDTSVFVLTPQKIGLQFEGFGLVYLEAGAYGLPVIGTASGGVPDAIKDNETGYLLDEKDVQGIANAMERLYRDELLARQMGRANRLWAETLTWERCAREHFEAYQEIFDTGYQPIGSVG